jgi:hypothetical protein
MALRARSALKSRHQASCVDTRAVARGRGSHQFSATHLAETTFPFTVSIRAVKHTSPPYKSFDALVHQAIISHLHMTSNLADSTNLILPDRESTRGAEAEIQDGVWGERSQCAITLIRSIL